MEIWKLITIVLGAGGFWRLLDILIKYKAERKLKAAETKNLYATAQNSIVSNWVQWSQTLEKRVKESENRLQIWKKLLRSNESRSKSWKKRLQTWSARTVNY